MPAVPPPPDWRRLGLAGNPVVNILPGTHLDWVDVPALLAAALAAPERPRAVELIAAKGAGKSTLLRAQAHALAAQGIPAAYVYLPPGAAYDGAWPEGAREVLLDEADRAPARALLRLGRAGRQVGGLLVLGTHVSRRALLERAGLPCTSFRVEALGATGWVERRLAAARVGPGTPDLGPWLPALREGCRHLNYALQRALYELFEDLARGAALDAAAVARALARARRELPPQ